MRQSLDLEGQHLKYNDKIRGWGQSQSSRGKMLLHRPSFDKDGLKRQMLASGVQKCDKPHDGRQIYRSCHPDGSAGRKPAQHLHQSSPEFSPAECCTAVHPPLAAAAISIKWPIQAGQDRGNGREAIGSRE